MLTKLKKCNTFLKNEQEYSYVSYDYFIKEVKIKNYIIKKVFIVDIRNMPGSMIDYIFNNFDEFQNNILSDDFFKSSELINKGLFTYSYNMDLIFLYDECKKYNIDKYKILYDMEYAVKRFMTTYELEEFLSKDYTNVNLEKERLIELKDRTLKLKSFNYINGYNGSGKTRLLYDISKVINVPVFSMNNINLNLENYIIDKNYLKKMLYQLAVSYEFDKYSDYHKYIYRLAQVLAFSREQKNMVLLDDLRWLSLDKRNLINLIDVLFDYTIDNEGIVITGCEQGSLIKRRVYKSNIIEL